MHSVYGGISTRYWVITGWQSLIYLLPQISRCPQPKPPHPAAASSLDGTPAWTADAVKGDGLGAELIRTIRKIAQVEERLRVLEATLAEWKAFPLLQLKAHVQGVAQFLAVCSTVNG